MYDQASDLDYLNARYYKADIGKFISEDPVFWEIGQTEDGIKALRDPQLQNSYSYAGNNPIVNKDPDGRQYVDINAGLTLPQCLCGPTAGFYASPKTNDPMVYFGIGVSYRPGPSASVTYSPTGSPSEGWSNSVSGFTGKGVGGQVGPSQNDSAGASMQYGIGTPGIGASITYSIQLSKLLNTLGGPSENVTTPMTIGLNISNSSTQQSSNSSYLSEKGLSSRGNAFGVNTNRPRLTILFANKITLRPSSP